MPPAGVSQPGEAIVDPAEQLLRRGRRRKGQVFVLDQVTLKRRPPAAVFEPRLPENRPDAKMHDRYLSVNVESSLLTAGEKVDWGCNHREFYIVRLAARACFDASLRLSWEPVRAQPDSADDNPHHGAIWGIVEAYRADPVAYDVMISALVKASEIIPECLNA